MKTPIVATIALGLLAGCAGIPDDPALLSIDRSRLPPANLALEIPGLGPCTDNPDRTLHLDSTQPVTVLVHGCFGSSGLFRALAQVYAFQGQQAACFTYDDRDSMMVSSGQLIAALDAMARKTRNKRITVIGHSQGGLIARKALIADRLDLLKNRDIDLRLVTVSAPFSGIASAETCGSRRVRNWSLGLVPLLCKIVTGDKWYEITYASDFIRRPGRLVDQVGAYLRVVTDERDSCRVYGKNGVCLEDDYVFSLAEQRLPAIDEGSGVKVSEVKAGHVEIVGDRRAVPVKLIALLQDHGILNPTEPGRRAAFARLLARLYLGDPTIGPGAGESGSAGCPAFAGAK